MKKIYTIPVTEKVRLAHDENIMEPINLHPTSGEGGVSEGPSVGGSAPGRVKGEGKTRLF